MQPWLLFALFIAFILLMHFLSSWLARMEARRLSGLTVVEPGKEYPNNHHVLGVGYYHATHWCWHPLPWNEFREGEGYYWDGKWHEQPDDRHVASSQPSLEEVLRVNEAWRKADPQRASDFWNDVDRFGFGTAIGRRTGS
jgi:hypothetical protein